MTTDPGPLPDTYEAAYTELQQILADVQDERVGIDDLAAQVARAALLIEYCREKLRQTEVLLEKL
jgi:exodeoxyribonuclease VII small subunit